ncbi:hypothetical protein MUP32_05785 [Candidatus Microgenomates bacterium]|nr:hypothetical protein [Candidatus Microgenomates bacterium]
MKLVKFPHFNRRISAVILWSLLLTITGVNLHYSFFVKMDNSERLKNKILAQPFTSRFHEELGQNYLTVNEKAAEKEYQLAQLFYKVPSLSDSKTLGQQSAPAQTWNNLVSKREKIKKEAENWEKLEGVFGDYTYAKMKLAVLYYLLNDREKSTAYLKTVTKENPSANIGNNLLGE